MNKIKQRLNQREGETQQKRKIHKLIKMKVIARNKNKMEKTKINLKI